MLLVWLHPGSSTGAKYIAPELANDFDVRFWTWIGSVLSQVEAGSAPSLPVSGITADLGNGYPPASGSLVPTGPAKQSARDTKNPFAAQDCDDEIAIAFQALISGDSTVEVRPHTNPCNKRRNVFRMRGTYITRLILGRNGVDST